ncbi:hypothetical protein BTGOE5_53450 [Bacillus thuringiensis]|nr:hypothetical protein BTGOE5_53450 [Bacillus thuringiensis]
MLLYVLQGYNEDNKLVTFKLSQFGINSAGLAEEASQYKKENDFASVHIFEAEWVETKQPVFGEYKITKRIGKI